jgi:hypothetical protein
VNNGEDEESPIRRYYRAEGSGTVATGGSVNQNNTISTPVLVVLMLALAIMGIVSGAAWIRSDAAFANSVIAEREARLAQERGDRLEVEVKVLRGVLETVGVPVPKQEE